MLRWLSAALRGKNKGAAPQAPGVDLSTTGNATIYAVGDVHGRLDLLRAVEDRIAADIPRGENAIVLYLGDMIDRGPESSGVLEHLRQKQGPGIC